MTAGRRTPRLASKIAPAVAVLCAFVALLLYLFFFELVFSAKLFLGAACLSVAVWAVSRRRAIARAFNKSRRAGVESFAINVLSFAAIVIVLFTIAANHRTAFDLTVNDTFTLSPYSMKAIDHLSRQVEIIGFVRSDDPGITTARDLFWQYDNASDLITARILDPDANPAEAARYGEAVYGKVLARCGQNQEWTSSWREESVTALITRVSSNARAKVYFLAGHGERPITGSGADSLSQAAIYLEFENLDVDSLELLGGQRVPTDASLIVMGPATAEFMPTELEAVGTYLSSGGRVLMLMEPGTASPLSTFLTGTGLEALGGEVIDPLSNVFNDPRAPAVSRQGRASSPITAGLPAVFFPGARPIAPSGQRSPMFEVKSVLVSSPASYAMQDSAVSGSEPIMGPFVLAASVEAPPSAFKKPSEQEAAKKPPSAGEAPGIQAHPGLLRELSSAARGLERRYSRIMVVADSDFASNRFIDELGNRQLLVSAVKWLLEAGDIASGPTAPRAAAPVVLTSADLNVIKFVSIILLPALAMSVGAGVGWRRR